MKLKIVFFLFVAAAALVLLTGMSMEGEIFVEAPFNDMEIIPPLQEQPAEEAPPLEQPQTPDPQPEIWQAAVSNFKVRRLSHDTLRLTWTKQAGATKYVIYRSTSKTGAYTKIATMGDVAGYTDRGLKTGKTYCYKVLPFKGSKRGQFSEIDWAKTSLDQLQNFSAVAADPVSARISFNAVAGADKYVIYRSTSWDGAYAAVRTLKSASAFRDRGLTTGVTYYYKAIPYSGSAKGEFTQPVAVTTKPLGKLTGLTAKSAAAGKITLSWNELPGANKYKIYRAKQEYYNYSNFKKPLSYKLYTTVSGASLTSFTDTRAGQGETYYYKVAPYCGSESSGEVGPVNASAKLSAKVTSFLKAARKELGKPYLLGGKGPANYDCSGFIYYALKQSGNNIPYMTSATWRASSYKTVSTANAQAGDILCYDGHVGIYAGAGMIIDASTNLNAVVERPLWGTVIHAKRIF